MSWASGFNCLSCQLLGTPRQCRTRIAIVFTLCEPPESYLLREHFSKDQVQKVKETLTGIELRSHGGH